MRVPLPGSLAGAALLSAALLVACGGVSPIPSSPGVETYEPTGPLPGSSQVQFSLARDNEPFEMEQAPWPTELARFADGHIDFRKYPGATNGLFSAYVRAASEDVTGFSLAPVAYFRFKGPTARFVPARIERPSARDAILLVDADPKSPERGKLWPVETHVFTRDMRFVRQGTLAVKTLDGFVLRPGTLYALALRRVLGGLDAEQLGTSTDLEAIKSTAPRMDPFEERARLMHEPGFRALASLGVGRAEVAAIALFRTQVAHRETQAALSAIGTLQGELRPRIVSAAWWNEGSIPGKYRSLVGRYCTPNHQSDPEEAPFLENGGGAWKIAASGAPEVVALPKTSRYRTPACGPLIQARFTLSVPDMPAPPGGFPLLVTAHGTGGDAFTALGANDFSGWAAAEGIAVLATDQPLHGGALGGRPGADKPIRLPLGIRVPPDIAGPEMAFYNPLFPRAARDNLRQAAVDLGVLVSLFQGLDLSSSAPQPGDIVQPLSPAVKLSATTIGLAGHSQGCQSVAVVGGLDARVKSVILSGCGGDVRIGILERADLPVRDWLTMLLGLDPEELSPFHPLPALLQQLADPIDPQAYARFYWEPPSGRGPTPVLHFEGLGDTYTAPAAAEALAVALRTEHLTPVVSAVPGLELFGPRPPGRRWLMQIEPAPGSNGHFVLYDDPRGSMLFRRFLRETLLASPRGD